MTYQTAIEWIKVIDNRMRPPSEEKREQLRAWLAESPNHLAAFREAVLTMMGLYDGGDTPRENNPAYRHFILEAMRAQFGFKRTARQ